MTQLWLVPVDEGSYRATLEEPIDLSDAPMRPADFPEKTRVWGVRTDPEQGSWERNRRNLEKMNVGDPLLVYRNGVGRYRAIGRLGAFWKTKYVRDEYWNSGPALDVFAVEDYREIDLAREEVNQMLDYKEDFWPQGLCRVGDDRPVTSLLNQIESAA